MLNKSMRSLMLNVLYVIYISISKEEFPDICCLLIVYISRMLTIMILSRPNWPAASQRLKALAILASLAPHFTRTIT